MKRSILVAFSVVAFLALAPPAGAKPLTSCGRVTVTGAQYRVTVSKGRVACAEARKVERAFRSGSGRRHCEAASLYRGDCPGDRVEITVDGWRCGDKGGCVRGGETIASFAMSEEEERGIVEAEEERKSIRSTEEAERRAAEATRHGGPEGAEAE